MARQSRTRRSVPSLAALVVALAVASALGMAVGQGAPAAAPAPWWQGAARAWSAPSRPPVDYSIRLASPLARPAAMFFVTPDPGVAYALRTWRALELGPSVWQRLRDLLDGDDEGAGVPPVPWPN